MPLAIGSHVIGEVQIAPRSNQQPNDGQIHLMKAIAQQTSLQIQNLKLLTEAERSCVEAEAATRRFVHEGWDSYLDVIQRQERIGYIYDGASVSPHAEEHHANGGIQISVRITDEPIGTVYVEPGSTHSLSQSDTAMVMAIADQVAQQVENILHPAPVLKQMKRCDDRRVNSRPECTRDIHPKCATGIHPYCTTLRG